MAKGSQQKRDAVFGRQGGRVVAWDDEPIDFGNLPRCDRCAGAMVCGQPGRHWMCCDVCTGCHRPVGPAGQNCECGKGKRSRKAKAGDAAS